MINILVNPEQIISFNIYLGLDKDKKLKVSAVKKDLIKDGVLDDQIIEHKIDIKVPNYRDNVQVASGSVTIDGDNVKVDPSTYRYERFVLLLKNWTFTDENGDAIPATRESIDKLNPDIATVIVDKITELSD